MRRKKKTKLPALEEYTMQLGGNVKKIKKWYIFKSKYTYTSTELYVNLENITSNMIFRVCADLLTMPGSKLINLINLVN